MSSFKRLVEQAEKLTAKLQEYSGLEKHLVENVIHYAKQLPGDGRGEIDQLIFIAQMAHQFEIYSPNLLQSMFESWKRPRATTMTIEEYSKLICMFLSTKPGIKTDFVFNVYDVDRDGCINRTELFSLLRSTMVITETEFTEADTNECIKELIDLTLKMMDHDLSGDINRSEFKESANKDSVYLQIFGQCLPSDQTLDRFRKLLLGMTPLELKAYFAEEKKKSLFNTMATLTQDNELYPIQLDIP
ncbi:calaxin-like [Physella acuta]|uniref:calaxin-like n=1 Tax=Physella acuta TaxID=109671 RepID=UPI0027DB154D|nr:calaxin-like [Physella acuta]